MGIELKRFHIARLKKKRRYYWGRDLSLEPDVLSAVVTTPKPFCKCMMCIPARKREGVTLQEKRALDVFNEAT